MWSKLNRIALVVVIMVSAFGSAQPSYAAAAVGKIELVEGDVKIIDAAGQTRVPQLNSFLQEGDTILTGKDGELHAHMDDEGYIALRPDTRLRVVSYSVNADKTDNVALALLKGSIRSITGWIGKKYPRNYHINAGPTATIGIRGTDHEPTVILEPSPGETRAAPPGAYDKVNSGDTYIQHPGGTIELGPSQAGYASHDPKEKPRVLDKVPEFYKPTKNESKIETRGAELSRQVDKKFEERQERKKSERKAKTTEGKTAAERHREHIIQEIHKK